MRSKSYWVSIFLVIVFLCSFGWSWQGRSYSKVTWEYKIFFIPPDQSHKSEAMLNDLGSQGWELVQKDQDNPNFPTSGYFYFKRPK